MDRFPQPSPAWLFQVVIISVVFVCTRMCQFIKMDSPYLYRRDSKSASIPDADMEDEEEEDEEEEEG